MPINSQIETTTNNNGDTVEKLHIEFSNGALVQLKELAEFFNTNTNNDPTETIKLAISLLQNIKDRSEEDLKNGAK